MIHALSLSCQLTPDLDKPFINRHLSPYIHLLAPGVQHMGASYLLSVDTKPKSLTLFSNGMGDTDDERSWGVSIVFYIYCDDGKTTSIKPFLSWIILVISRERR